MFAFSQVESRDQGQVTPNIPLSRYLGAAWDQGVHDAMGGSLYRISEQWQMENNVSLWGALDQQAGRMLDPNEANDRYGTRRLRFTEPVYEGVAELLKNRHDENETRNFILSSGGAGVGRFAASFGVGMLASLSNPVDFTTMFVPIVGSEALATKLATMGLSPVRQGLARGLITEERLRAIVPAPRVVAAIIEGTVGQAIAEVPLYISNRMDQTPYTVMDSLQNIALGGAFAGTLRLALSGAGRLVGRLMPDTKKALAQKGLADFLLGDDVKVHELVNLDENVIREKVEFDLVAAKKAAREAVAGADSELKNWAEAQLDVQGHLGGVDQPNLFKVAEDWIPIWKEQGKGAEIVSKLLERAKQDPSIENLTNLASQFNLKFDPMERKLPSQYYLAKPKDVARMQHVAGVSDADLKVTGQLSNAQRRQQAAVLSMQRKDHVDRLVREEKDRRIKAYVEDLRKKFDPEQETRKKINQEVMEQQKLGRVLSTEQVEKYKQSDRITEQDVAVLEKDVENLKKSLDIKDDDADLREFADALEKKMEKGGTTGAIEHIVKSLEGLKIDVGPKDVKKMYSGIPPEAWNGFIDVVIGLVKTGKKLADAVDTVLSSLKLSQEESFNFRLEVYGKLSDAEYLSKEGIVEEFFPKGKLTREASQKRSASLHLGADMGFDYGAKIEGYEPDLLAPKIGDIWYHGRRRGSAPLKKNELLWISEKESVAKDYATEFGRGGAVSEEDGGYAYKLEVTKELNPARTMEIRLAAEKVGAKEPNSGTGLDYLYDPKVVEYLKSKGYDSAIGWDILIQDEFPTIVLFDAPKQIKPIAAMDLGHHGELMGMLEPEPLSKTLFGPEALKAFRECVLK